MKALQADGLDGIDVADEVVRWRFEALLRAGYDAGSALVVAEHAEVDLHEAVRLVQRGCPPVLALQIVL